MKNVPNFFSMAPEMMMVTTNPNTSRWNMEDGYDIESTEIGYPIRVYKVKQSVALAIFLQISGNDIEYSCRGLVPGFKILLHMPGEVPPTTTRHSFRVPLSEEALIAIKPTLITTSNNLRSYDPNLRQCFFSSERKLRFFKMYTQNNCELECLANFTKSECKCVAFHMPSKKLTFISSLNQVIHVHCHLQGSVQHRFAVRPVLGVIKQLKEDYLVNLLLTALEIIRPNYFVKSVIAWQVARQLFTTQKLTGLNSTGSKLYFPKNFNSID